MTGVPLEEEDIIPFVHIHNLGGALAKKEIENICSKMNKQKGSLFKTAQKMKMTVEKLNQVIQELGLEDVIAKIRLGFCEEILGQSSFAERLDLALTKDKYLIDLGIEDEVDASLRKELDELLSTLDDNPDLEQSICKELSLDEERYQRLVKRFELEQLLGVEPSAETNQVRIEAAPGPDSEKPDKVVAVTQPDKSSRSQTVEKRVCSQPGCEREIRCRGLCPKHYERRKYIEKKTGKKLSSTDPLPPPVPRVYKRSERKICSQPGCERLLFSRDLCSIHYRQIRKMERRTGKKLSSADPLPPPIVRKPAKKGICSQPRCERLSSIRGLCTKHYQHRRKIEIRTGKKLSSTEPLPPLPPLKARKPAQKRICSQPGCEQTSRSRGLCAMHYQQLNKIERRTGERLSSTDPLPPPPPRIRKPAEKKICAEPGCEQTSRSRGLCRNHYGRLRYKERKVGKKLSSTEPLPPPAQEFAK